jgi:uncharacterized membrane protein
MNNLHLIVSSVIVLLAALSYGIFPNTVLPLLFDFHVENIDLNNVFRAVMGLYLGNVLIMSGLVVGRLISLVTDCVPSPMFHFGLVGELVLAIWCLIHLRQDRL